jgi:hypothetical protein
MPNINIVMFDLGLINLSTFFSITLYFTIFQINNAVCTVYNTLVMGGKHKGPKLPWSPNWL